MISKRPGQSEPGPFPSRVKKMMQEHNARTIGAMLRDTAARFPERTALEYMGQSWSYRYLDEAVDGVARELLGLGIRRGDHVGIWCKARLAPILAMYALLRVGAVPTMLNTALQREELKTLLVRNDVQYLLIGNGYKDLDYATLCRGLDEEIEGLRGIYQFGMPPTDGQNGSLLFPPCPLASEQLLREAEAAVGPEDTAFLLFTSGTTSVPKGVATSHAAWVTYCRLQADNMDITEADRFCAALPMFHCFCIGVNLLLACWAGSTVCLPNSRHSADVLTCISEEKCTVFSCVPALYHALLRRPDFETWDVSSLRTGIIGGSSYPVAFFHEVEEKLGMTLISSLGMTEATAGLSSTTVRDSLEVRAATVGRVLPVLEGRILDIKTGAALPAGECGEVCVRGSTVMKGYYNMPQETAKALDSEGWLHTGDMGFLDEEGYLHLTGRLKDLIIRGGENISPLEIESVLAEDPTVNLCKAVGVPDDHYGEEVCLCVLPTQGAVCTEQALRQSLTQQLSSYKVPKYILFFDEFPISSTGKVLGRELRTQALERLGLN